MATEKTLVTGATGFVGRALVERLVSLRQDVVALTRQHSHGLPKRVEVRIGDLATGAGVSRDLFDSVRRVFHCAGEITRPSAMQRLHVVGTERLLACVPQSSGNGAGVRWIQLSSVGAYGPPDVANRVRRIDEESPENPVGEYEITKAESDRLVRRFAAEGRISCTVLRLSSIIGARMSNSSLRRVVSVVERGWVFHVGSPEGIATYVHIDDVVSALLACSDAPEAGGQIFNLSSDCLWKDLVDHVACERGVRTPRIRVPEPALRMAVRLVGAAGRFPLTASGIDALVSRTSYPSAKIQSLLGFQFSRPMPAAVSDLMSPVVR